MSRAGPTPYPGVNEILNILLFDVKKVLSDQFVGMYLYGSLSSGDFNLATSDIDFLVVTEDHLPESKTAQLESMHERIWSGGHAYASKLEGAYVPRRAIRRHNPDDAPCPTINEGTFYLARPGSDWIIQRHVVREHGVIVEGPDPRTLIDHVGPDDIREAIRGVLREWWFPMLEDSSWLESHPGNYHGFAVITMCRALHGLETGVIASKPAAVAWAREKLGSEWNSLLDQAVASQYDRQSEFLAETLDLIRFIKASISEGDRPLVNAQDPS